MTIKLVGDNFSSAEQGHHLLQTIKFFGAIGEEPKRQFEILDSINPFSGPFLRNDSKLKRFLSALFGYSFNIEKTSEKANNLTAKVNGNQDHKK